MNALSIVSDKELAECKVQDDWKLNCLEVMTKCIHSQKNMDDYFSRNDWSTNQALLDLTLERLKEEPLHEKLLMCQKALELRKEKLGIRVPLSNLKL